jgi:hypothetical protein
MKNRAASTIEVQNPFRRLLLPAIAALAVTGAAFLAPSAASADGPPIKGPQSAVFIGGGAQGGAVVNGIWVPQGSPAVGQAEGWVVEDFDEFPARAPQVPKGILHPFGDWIQAPGPR